MAEGERLQARVAELEAALATAQSAAAQEQERLSGEAASLEQQLEQARAAAAQVGGEEGGAGGYLCRVPFDHPASWPSLLEPPGVVVSPSNTKGRLDGARCASRCHVCRAVPQASQFEQQLAAATEERRQLEQRAAELEAELVAAQRAQRAPAEAEGRAAELEAQLGEARAAAEKVGGRGSRPFCSATHALQPARRPAFVPLLPTVRRACVLYIHPQAGEVAEQQASLAEERRRLEERAAELEAELAAAQRQREEDAAAQEAQVAELVSQLEYAWGAAQEVSLPGSAGWLRDAVGRRGGSVLEAHRCCCLHTATTTKSNTAIMKQNPASAGGEVSAGALAACLP